MSRKKGVVQRPYEVWVLTIVLFITGINLTAQDMTFSESVEVQRAMRTYEQRYNNSEERLGWRIQFIYTEDRRELERNYDRIKRAYPEHKVFWEHKTPFYIIKGGAFQTELEARRFIHSILDEYPSALPRREMVTNEEVLSSMN